VPGSEGREREVGDCSLQVDFREQEAREGEMAAEQPAGHAATNSGE
jgi:hypothetical protein